MDQGEQAAEEYKAFKKYTQNNLRNAPEPSSVDYHTEFKDSDEEIDRKVKKLAALIKNAQHAIVYTGAGISTSSGIPDYRSPNGVWTKRVKGEAIDSAKIKNLLVSAAPTLGHKILLNLTRAGLLKHIITTNVDGLFRKVGFEISEISEIHGNLFVEECSVCLKQYYRDYYVRNPSVGHFEHKTGKKCEECGGDTRDIIFNFGNTVEHVPSLEAVYDVAWSNAIKADVMLVLGSSLSVAGAVDLIDYCHDSEGDEYFPTGKIVIVNNQNTPKDGIADLVVHAPCDVVLSKLASELHI